jgi:hypothetical protein
MILVDTTANQFLPECKPTSLKATFKNGGGQSGAGIGSITSATFSNCVWVLSYTFTLTSSGLPWQLNVRQYDPSTGVTTGTITGIHITIAGSDCGAVVDGTGANADNGQVDVTYTNSTHKLKMLTTGGNLHYYDVIGCVSLVNSGDAAEIAAISKGTGKLSALTYTVSPAQTITKP